MPSFWHTILNQRVEHVHVQPLRFQQDGVVEWRAYACDDDGGNDGGVVVVRLYHLYVGPSLRIVRL